MLHSSSFFFDLPALLGGPLVGGACAGLIYKFFLSIETPKEVVDKSNAKDIGLKSMSSA